VNVFFVHRPYQMLNATEYVKHANLDDCHLVVLDADGGSRAQFTPVVDPSLWASIRFFPLRDLFRYRDFSQREPSSLADRASEIVQALDQAGQRFRLERLARTLTDVDQLVLGSYRAGYARYMRHLANRIPHRKLVLIDVGTDTIEINRQRVQEFECGTVQYSPRGPATDSASRRFRRALNRKYVEWDTAGVDSLTFFTGYDLTPSPADHVVGNTYKHLRSRIGTKPKGHEVWFLGQPIADQEYVDWFAFAELIVAVVRRYTPENLRYVPHPHESQRQLDIVADAGVRVLRFSSPIEHAMSVAAESPALLAGFFSSALANCASIYGDALDYEAVRIPEPALLKQKENLRDIYDSFRTEGFEGPGTISVINLP